MSSIYIDPQKSWFEFTDWKDLAKKEEDMARPTNTSRINTNKKEIGENEDRILALQKDAESGRKEVSSLEIRVVVLEKQVKEQGANIVSINKTLNRQDTRLNTCDSDMEGCNAEVKVVENVTDYLEKRVLVLETHSKTIKLLLAGVGSAMIGYIVSSLF